MNKIRTLIVDDEQSSRDTVQQILNTYCLDIEVVGEADSVDSAVDAIKNLAPELLLLDIEIKNGTGFDVLQKIDPINFDVIFITGFNDFAIKAFKFSAIDYILKPFDSIELIESINKVRIGRERNSYHQKLQLFYDNEKAVGKKIALPTMEGLSMVWVEDIIRCVSDNSYTTFYMKSQPKLMVSKGIKEYEELLIPFHFFRVHQSHLVNLKEVKSFLKDDGGVLLMVDESRVPVARRRKEHLLDLLTQL